MPLPDILEVVPWDQPPVARITVPGSKSITNRALALAALADGETQLRGALWSDDTQVMVAALQQLGFDIDVQPDPGEAGNRHLRVIGRGGQIPAGGTRERPVELFVGLAGTAARFLTAMLCLGEGIYRVHGVQRMHERPQGPLLKALRQLGYTVEGEIDDDHLPVLIHGDGPREGATATVSTVDSSQFASALLLIGGTGGWQITTEEPTANPYIEMTRQQIAAFPTDRGTVVVEPDASSGSYFWGADALPLSGERDLSLKGNIQVDHWPASGWQVDAEFPRHLPLPARLSRRDDLGDSILTAMMLAPLGNEPVLFADLTRLRVQECERVQVMREELSKCGAGVVEEGETLLISPSELHGADIDPHEDHRVAMCFAMLGLRIPGIRIHDPGCVAKTFPLFFHKLSQAAPHGLGVELRDGAGTRWMPDNQG
ncbi:MAG: 3-phosphoshikimate 1-carboxyvinyltransferase [Gemmatimonadetes bacterium]|nr:3-phosphoshikimate 1-carboxyvinyltransferase [Gemmatimonadota bacterium]MBT7863191.1 3-phosphoshikimate 1-carboxyvinyltransferase [Gemmatimonadota bacterium]